MKKTALRLAAVAAVAGLGIAGCSSSNSGTGGNGSTTPSSNNNSSASENPSSSGGGGGGDVQVGVILPDTQSSARWESADKPALTKAFSDAGIKADIQNALGDKSKFQSIAQGMIQEKVKVLILVALDSPSAATVEQQAQQAGIKTIDYDRLVLGGSAQFYVSYDNVEVGKLQGQCLLDAMNKLNKPSGQIIYVDGSPTDNNATLFAQGAHSVLDGSTLKAVGEKAVPDWDNAKAGTIFQQLLTANGNKVDGVLVANDGMAQSVITVLKGQGLNGKVPVTGQDATVAGLQSILRGDQTCTIYKDATNEANAAAKLAIDLIQGKDGSADATQKTHDGTGNRDVPSVLLKPEVITIANVGRPIETGAVKYGDVCTGDLVAKCTAAGINAS